MKISFAIRRRRNKSGRAFAMKIRAAVFRDTSGKPSIETLDLAGPGPGEVLVRIVAAGVCHTDIKMAGSTRVPRPVVLGHEGSGIVEAVGAGVSEFAEGDHVVMSFGYCGRCPSCRDAEPAYCHEQERHNFRCERVDAPPYLTRDGETVHGDFFAQSSFATYAIGNERSVVKVTKDAPLELLGPLGCGIQTGAGAVLNDLRLQPGQSIVVYGVGSLGLSAVMAARLAGASKIIAVDRNQKRLAMARELGADVSIQAGAEPVTGEIRAHMPDGVNFALDTTGAIAVTRQSIDVIAPRGTAAFVTGPLDGSEISFSPRLLMPGIKFRGIIEGNSNPKRFIPQLIDHYLAGRFPFDKLISFYEFEEIEQAIHDSETGESVKPVLRMH